MWEITARIPKGVAWLNVKKWIKGKRQLDGKTQKRKFKKEQKGVFLLVGFCLLYLRRMKSQSRRNREMNSEKVMEMEKAWENTYINGDVIRAYGKAHMLVFQWSYTFLKVDLHNYVYLCFASTIHKQNRVHIYILLRKFCGIMKKNTYGLSNIIFILRNMNLHLQKILSK